MSVYQKSSKVFVINGLTQTVANAPYVCRDTITSSKFGTGGKYLAIYEAGKFPRARNDFHTLPGQCKQRSPIKLQHKLATLLIAFRRSQRKRFVPNFRVRSNQLYRLRVVRYRLLISTIGSTWHKVCMADSSAIQTCYNLDFTNANWRSIYLKKREEHPSSDSIL